MRYVSIHNLCRNVLCVLLTLLCAACVSTQTVANETGQKWSGRSVDEFVMQYGTPYSKFTLGNGDVAYTWNLGVSNVVMPTTATTNVVGNTAYTQLNGGGNVHMSCEMQLITEPSGSIRQVRILQDTVGLWTTSRCHEIL